MRRVPVACATLCLSVVLVVAGCGKGGDDAATPTESATPTAVAGADADPAALPEVTGEWGKSPEVLFPLKPGAVRPTPAPTDTTDPADAESGDGTDDSATEPTDGASDTESSDAEASPSTSETPEEPSPYLDPPTTLQVVTLVEGEGPALEMGDLIAANYFGIVWGSLDPFEQSFTSFSPLVAKLAVGGLIEGWTTGLWGQKVGSRLMLVIPPEMGYGAAGQGESIPPNSTLTFIIDIIDRWGPDAQAQADAAPTGAETPVTVTGAIGQAAAIEIPAGAPEPTTFQKIVLATGTGEAVAALDTVVFHFTAKEWDGTLVNDSWEAGTIVSTTVYAPTVDEEAGTTTSTIFGALVGQPVGSRILIISPAKLGVYPAQATLIDIIGRVPANDIFSGLTVDDTTGTDETGTDPTADPTDDAADPDPTDSATGDEAPADPSTESSTEPSADPSATGSGPTTATPSADDSSSGNG